MKAYIVGHKTITRGEKHLVIIFFNYEDAHVNGLASASACVSVDRFLHFQRYESVLNAFWSKERKRVMLYVPKEDLITETEM